jgi:hypothetical protein
MPVLLDAKRHRDDLHKDYRSKVRTLSTEPSRIFAVVSVSDQFLAAEPQKRGHGSAWVPAALD